MLLFLFENQFKILNAKTNIADNIAELAHFPAVSADLNLDTEEASFDDFICFTFCALGAELLVQLVTDECTSY